MASRPGFARSAPIYCSKSRTEDNNYLSTPPEVARRLPRRSQELLGYAAHDAIASGGGYLGTVDLLDPIDLLNQGKL
jgi:hypothetical protein